MDQMAVTDIGVSSISVNIEKKTDTEALMTLLFTHILTHICISKCR